MPGEIEEDEVMERLNQYSMLFDKSLLKLFGESCKESKLGKAFSIARLIKTDKALLAASRIAENGIFESCFQDWSIKRTVGRYRWG